jgi:Cation transport ATPase
LNEHGTRVTKFIPILNIDCPTCTTLLEKEVEKLKGVEEARVNYMNKTVRVKFDPELVGLADVEKVIERLGYRIAYRSIPGSQQGLENFSRKE